MAGLKLGKLVFCFSLISATSDGFLKTGSDKRSMKNCMVLLNDVVKTVSVPYQRRVILSHFAYAFGYFYVIIFDQLISIWKKIGTTQDCSLEPFKTGNFSICLEGELGHYFVIFHFGTIKSYCLYVY